MAQCEFECLQLRSYPLGYVDADRRSFLDDFIPGYSGLFLQVHTNERLDPFGKFIFIDRRKVLMCRTVPGSNDLSGTQAIYWARRGKIAGQAGAQVPILSVVVLGGEQSIEQAQIFVRGVLPKVIFSAGKSVVFLPDYKAAQCLRYGVPISDVGKFSAIDLRH